MEAEYMSRIAYLQRQLHTTQLALKHYMMNQNGGNGSNFNSLESKEDHVSFPMFLFVCLLLSKADHEDLIINFFAHS